METQRHKGTDRCATVSKRSQGPVQTTKSNKTFNHRGGLYMLGPWSGILIRCDLVGEGVELLEDMSL